MLFTYNSVSTRPNVGVQWFKDANSVVYNNVVTEVKNAPGFIGGTWQQDPTNPNKFLISHTWDNKQSWQNMSNALKQTANFKARDAYNSANNINHVVYLSE